MVLPHLIELGDVRRLYRMGQEKIIALDGISLTINKGETCCLLGPSGSGKSTLLSLMAGLEKPTRGRIQIKGKSIEKMNESQLAGFRQRHVGFVFQSYNLLPALTALENVEIPLIFKGVRKAIRVKKAKAMLEAVGLGDRLRHKPSEMSGGQQQRVSIARAFIGNPEIVFADEPTGNLDTKTGAEVMELITALAKKNEQTLIIVTHDPEIAGYADKVLYIRDGKIERTELKNESRGGYYG